MDPHAIALRWNEAFTFSVSEYRRLAALLDAGATEDTPADGPDDCPIWSYADNICDTLHEAGVPLYGTPRYVHLAEGYYSRALARADGSLDKETWPEYQGI